MEREIGSQQIEVLSGRYAGQVGEIIDEWSNDYGSFVRVRLDDGTRLDIETAAINGRPAFSREIGS